MSKMLLSSNPVHVDSILQGKKQYEFRKRRCKDGIDTILIYATAPQKKVVAEAEIKQVLVGTVQDVWKKTKKGAGISEDFFQAYYKGKTTAVAYELGRIIRFKKPLDLDTYGLSCAPQSFAYVD